MRTLKEGLINKDIIKRMRHNNKKIIKGNGLHKNVLEYCDIVFDAAGYTYIYLSDKDLKRFRYGKGILISLFKPYSTGKDMEQQYGYMSLSFYDEDLNYMDDHDYDICGILKGVVTQKDIDAIKNRDGLVELFKKNKNFSEYR